jgi:hypothetical protein
MATGYGLDGRGSIPGRIFATEFRPGPRAYPAPFPIVTSGSFPGSKAARAYS